MNKFTALKALAGFDNRKLSEFTGVDMVTLFLFERDATPVSLDVAQHICEALDSELIDMFPAINDLLIELSKIESDEEIQTIMQHPENTMLFQNSGIDPDDREWIMIVILISGIERRYKLTTIELDEVRRSLIDNDQSDEFLSFYSDCQQVFIKKGAVAEVKFLSSASYAPFRSNERAFSITIVSKDSVRPEVIGVMRDGGYDGNGERSFANLVKSIHENLQLPSFFLVDSEDEEERYISISGLEVLEIPMGIIMPEIYESETDPLTPEVDSALDSMEMAGSA